MARIELVVAVAENGVIGHKGDMPWRLPSDLKHFKQVTMGLPVIMGRRTWESIGRVLPGRKNIVISRSLTDLPDGAVQVATPDAALEAADNERVMIIGGGEIYRIFEPQAEIVHLTQVHLRRKVIHFSGWPRRMRGAKPHAPAIRQAKKTAPISAL